MRGAIESRDAMMDILIGIVCLVALIALKSAMGHRAQRRFTIAWEEAQVEIARGNHESAMVHVADCVRLMPLWLPPRFLLGSLLARHGKLAEAEEQYKMARALQPREAVGYVELGIFYITMANRVDDGITQLREALAHDASALQKIESDPRLREFRDSPAYGTLEQR